MSIASFTAFVHALRAFYGLQPTPPKDLFQFVVWEILSSHALSARRDLAWLALKRIPALTPDAMFRTPAIELLEAIGLGGAHREEKLERLRGTVAEFKRNRERLDADALRHAGLLRSVRTLRGLSQVESGVQARALLFSPGYLVLPIDEDLGRVVSRLASAVPPSPPRIAGRTAEGQRLRRTARRWLTDRLPREIGAYREAVVYLRHHAQHTCVAVGPHCTVCPLRTDCPSAVHVHSRD